MADMKINVAALCSIFDGDGVHFLVKDGLGSQLYCSKDLPPTLAKSEDFVSADVIYDSNKGKYFLSRTVATENNEECTIFVDISEYILTINRLRRTVSQREMIIEDLRSTIEKLKIDNVTGIPIRGETLANMKDYVRHANKNKEPFAIVMFDIDRFKAVNDTYGHDVGDEILRGVAETLRSSIRQYSKPEDTRKKDIIGRFGGEEFIILLKDIEPHHAFSVSDRIRRQVETKRFFVSSAGNSYPISVTVSAGVAHNNSGDKSLDDMISYSDQAMYQSKNNGRNCVTVYENAKRKVKTPQSKPQKEENK